MLQNGRHGQPPFCDWTALGTSQVTGQVCFPRCISYTLMKLPFRIRCKPLSAITHGPLSVLTVYLSMMFSVYIATNQFATFVNNITPPARCRSCETKDRLNTLSCYRASVKTWSAAGARAGLWLKHKRLSVDCILRSGDF